MTEPIKLGFGNGDVGAMALVGVGTLLCRRGETATLDAPEVDWREQDRRWRARAAGVLDLAFEPLGAPAGFADGTREWLCRVSGFVDDNPLECLGHVVLGASGAAPEWRRTSLRREVAAWLDVDLGFAVHARRPARADAHDAEELEAIVLRGDPPEPVRIEDPRLSTAYAERGAPRRAGLELWETEESDHAVRLAGETIGEGELKLPDGSLLRSAFMLWRHDGATGIGRYDLARPQSP